MIFSSIKDITIPEGVVKQIADSEGRILWKGGAVDVSTMVIGYTGAYTDQTEVTMSGKKYRLLTLTGSGTLTLPEEVTADVWLCNGGNGGLGAGRQGGGGGYVRQENGMQITGAVVVVVGAGSAGVNSSSGKFGGLTSFGSVSPTAQSSGAYVYNGASGGGNGGRTSIKGEGGGVSTVPFGETSLFDQHSAGGGGGGERDREADDTCSGGDGGSNGGSGLGSGGYSGYVGGTGGTKGGGNGGTGNSQSSLAEGGAATYFGSGGGAGGHYVSTSGTGTLGYGGAGYQGVIYVRIPYEQ